MKLNLTEAGSRYSFSRLIEPKAYSVLTKVGSLLTEQGVDSYLVGGFLRDVLLGRDTADIDFAVSSDALEVASKIAAALGGREVLLDKMRRVARVVLLEKEIAPSKVAWKLDFSTFEGSIEEDLARRDFTIDAMAIKLAEFVRYPVSHLTFTAKKEDRVSFRPPELIDPFHGWEDLQQAVIRVVSERAFTSDADRLLRAVRLASELGFSLDGKTEKLIQSSAHLVAGVSG